jgi:DNA modification methylase
MAPVKAWEGNTDLRKLLVPVGELRRHPSNPRRGDMDAIRASLRRFGQQRPVLALPDGTIVAGNHTFQGTVDEGWTHCAVVRSDLTEAEVDAYLAADNRTGDLGTYDDEVLARLLQPMWEADRLLGTGYDAGFVKRLLKQTREPSPEDDDTPVIPETPRSVRGETYELGGHRLMCGDSTSAADYAKCLDGVVVTLALADPPYNVDEDYDEYDDALSLGDYQRFTEAWFGLMAEHSAAQIVTPGWNNLRLWSASFPWSAIGVWTKSNAMTRGSVSRFNTWEPILFYGSGWKRDRAFDVFDVSVRQQPGGAGQPIGGRFHPCPKPVQLWRELGEYAQRGNNIFDPFAGAGTIFIAAEQLGMTAYGLELDPGYCDVIRQRYADYVGDQSFAP